jgi:hypothetical protein
MDGAGGPGAEYERRDRGQPLAATIAAAAFLLLTAIRLARIRSAGEELGRIRGAARVRARERIGNLSR